MAEARDRRWLAVALPAGVALITAAVFAGALRNEFVALDDDYMLVRNPAFRGFSPAHLRWMLQATVGGHWHPLTWLTFAVDHAIWGLDPRGYHLTNLLLHAAAAAAAASTLAALLARAQPGVPPAARRLGAAVAALVWAVHPLRVESVAWVTERRDVVSALFWILALRAYLAATRAAPSGPTDVRWLAAAAASLGLSLLGKSWGMTFFVLLLVVDAYPLGRWRAGHVGPLLFEKVPFALLGIGTAVLVWRAVHAYLPDLGEHAAGERLGQAAYGLCFYLWKTCWPTGLVPMVELRGRIDPWAWPFSACIAAVVVLSATLLALRRRWPAGLAAWTSYGLVLAPVLGVTQAGPQLVADRYAHLATLPWFALVAAGLAHAFAAERAGVRRAAGVAAAGATAALAVATVRQVAVWRTTETLWAHAVAVDPDNAFARLSLGAALDDAGRLDEARVQWDALAAIVAAHPDDVAARARLGLAEARLAMAAKHDGRLDEARERLERAIALNPADGRLRINLGGVLLDLGQPAAAAAQWEDGLARSGDGAPIRATLASALLGARAWPEAEAMLHRARRLAPRDPALAVDLGIALWQQGRRDEATAAWEEALALDPENAAARDLLARARAAGRPHDG